MGLYQCFENNLFEDAKKLFSQLVCELKTIPVSPRNQDEYMKVTKSLFTLESGLSNLTIRAYCSDNFEQVRLGSTYKLGSEMVTDSAAAGNINFTSFGVIVIRAATPVCFTKTLL